MGFESLGRLCFAFSAAYLLLLLHAESSPRGNAICNFYKGRWVYDETYPIYDAKSCPFMRQEFDCQRYGRPDTMYLKYRWKPDGCELPSGNDWGDSPRKSCSGQAKPLNGSIYPAGPLAEQAIVKNVLNSMSKPVPLLDITLLSQLRIDAHPSKYNGIKFRNDCSHWCIAGLPDTWNQLLYASLLKIQEK